ncbi:MAG: Ig domain-containing protein, partial [Isosphaeraceae bacterium]|nr:Ig domain-containing protein [Isosphaeraceae bacterium]
VTAGTLPAGLSLSTAGLLSGTPTATGASSFTVTATDNNSDSGSQAFTLTVDPAITFTTTSLPAATVGAAYSQQITATGGSGTLTYAVTTGTLPAGLSLSTAGLLSGTPTATGASSFTVTATDNNGDSAGQAYTLTVDAATTGPTVTKLQRFGFHEQPTIFVLTFSTALNPTPAQNVSNYTLVPLVNGVAGTPIPLSSAVYNATNNTVTLTPTHNVYLYAQYQLTVNGTSPSGLTDTSGNFLAGASGQSGTNYVKAFGDEILSGPNIPSGTPTALANFINNEWTNDLAARFAALAAAAGDSVTPAATAAVATNRSATPAVKIASATSRATPQVAAPVTAFSAATSAALTDVHPARAAVDAVLATIVPADTDKKKS